MEVEGEGEGGWRSFVVSNVSLTIDRVLVLRCPLWLSLAPRPYRMVPAFSSIDMRRATHGSALRATWTRQPRGSRFASSIIARRSVPQSAIDDAFYTDTVSKC